MALKEIGILELEKIKEYLELHPEWDTVMELAESSLIDEKFGLKDGEERGYFIGEKLDLEVYSIGGSRVVFKMGNCVIKIPLESFGFSQNENEREFWFELPDDLKKYFCPFVFGESHYAIFQKAETFLPNEFDVFKEKVEEIITFLESKDVCLDDSESDRWDQWGLVNGEPVVIDYGRCYFRNH